MNVHTVWTWEGYHLMYLVEECQQEEQEQQSMHNHQFGTFYTIKD